MNNTEIFTTKLHWVSYIKCFLFMFFGAFITFIIALFSVKYSIIGGIIFVLGLIRFFVNKSVKITVSDNYYTISSGILSKTHLDIPLNKNEAFLFHQSLLGRWLNYGTILINTGGVNHSITVENPNELRKFVLQKKSSLYNVVQC